MHEGLSWTAIAAIGIPLVTWMLTTSALLAVGTYQLRRLTNNHIPHIEKKLDRLLQGEGLICKQHTEALKDVVERVQALESHAGGACKNHREVLTSYEDRLRAVESREG